MNNFTKILASSMFVAAFAVPAANAECNYPLYTGGNRNLTSFTLTDGENSAQFMVNQTKKTGVALYFDLTEEAPLETSPGAEISFSQLSWDGAWMHGYVFIDYNGDGEYDMLLNADGATDGELVAYSAYSEDPDGDEGPATPWLNSKGEPVEAGSGVSVSSMPSFTLPADLAPGTYKALFKIDWNSIEPCGSSKQGIGVNSGCAVEFTIEVSVDEVVCDYGTYGHTGRALTSFGLTDGENTAEFQVNQQKTQGVSIYFDLTNADPFVTSAGAEISFSQLNWQGEWMHGYLYIDYDKKNGFGTKVNPYGENDGELVSYSYYDEKESDYGTNSIGQRGVKAEGVKASFMPKFTIPADLAPGTYKALFKIDWNSLEPCGNPDPKNPIGKNGGVAVAFTIEIPDPNAAPAGDVEDILGTYKVDYAYMLANQLYEDTAYEVTISQVDGNDVLISNNILPFYPGLNDIEATYNPKDNSLVIANEGFKGDATFALYIGYFYDNGDYDWIDEVVFDIDEDGTIYTRDNDYITFYLRNVAGGYWEYIFGDIVMTPSGETAVKGLTTEELNNVPVVYYDLQGRKVNNPSNGLFIRQQGDKTSKVIIK